MGFVSQHVRAQLHQAFADFKSDDVVVEFFPRKHKYSSADRAAYNDLLNTSYALCPRGDGRWNFRFSEVVGACSIPVVIADGLTLPFSEIIDWSDVVITLPEAIITNIDASPHA